MLLHKNMINPYILWPVAFSVTRSMNDVVMLEFPSGYQFNNCYSLHTGKCELQHFLSFLRLSSSNFFAVSLCKVKTTNNIHVFIKDYKIRSPVFLFFQWFSLAQCERSNTGWAQQCEYLEDIVLSMVCYEPSEPEFLRPFSLLLKLEGSYTSKFVSMYHSNTWILCINIINNYSK